MGAEWIAAQTAELIAAIVLIVIETIAILVTLVAWAWLIVAAIRDREI